MKSFSIIELEKLDSDSKTSFFQELSGLLREYVNDNKEDDVLDAEAIINFINANGVVPDAFETVSELYHNASAGIQVGSGNQNLYNSLVAILVSTWDNLFCK